jgi:hypothetical protein
MVARHHEPRGIHRRIRFTVTTALKARFEAKVDRNGPVPSHAPALGPCWLWRGAMRNGYGAIKHEGKTLGTHVVSYVIANGNIPADMLVTHKCDNRQCCNPDHLRAGTYSDNVREALDRRAVNKVCGVKHPFAKFSEQEVQLIRAYKIARRKGHRSVSRLLGYGEAGVKNIQCRQNWRHLPWPTPEEAEALVAAHEASISETTT